MSFGMLHGGRRAEAVEELRKSGERESGRRNGLLCSPADQGAGDVAPLGHGKRDGARKMQVIAKR